MSLCFIFLITFQPFDGVAEELVLRAGGATFPYPLYKKWIEVYQEQTGQRIMYQSIGSGAGIEGLKNRQFDFGATDAFLPDEATPPAEEPILHVPTCIGAVVITCNLPGSPKLKLSADTVAAIFLGQIVNWKELNPTRDDGGSFPDLPITVVRRSDGSGTTFIFTNYLAKVSTEWRTKVGAGKAVEWPCGVGIDGNHGVWQMINRINGSIGYVEWTYAAASKLPVASIKNRSGRFMEPSVESITASADVSLPLDTKILLVDSEAHDAYPICGFTYLILYREQHYGQRTIGQAQALSHWLRWTIHEGQSHTKKLGYAPLPSIAVERADVIINMIRFDGSPVSGK